MKTESIKKASEEEKIIIASKGQTSELTVSGDRSWRKRGFSPLYGFISLTGWHIKKVIDIWVKSKYCKSCEHWKKKQGMAEYEEWATLHESVCEANHSGSFGKMEGPSGRTGTTLQSLVIFWKQLPIQERTLLVQSLRTDHTVMVEPARGRNLRRHSSVHHWDLQAPHHDKVAPTGEPSGLCLSEYFYLCVVVTSNWKSQGREKR
ncbi:hypothetical protein EAI_02755 [Harpegnathos saltator]|uniref:Mutator-like transposase domain-containing protein n=1 Tax=Harpegnathos saltator TaxID=610380 RepID=E2B458_HARSA|nr:hypothetical protein EAI_02755 [Harpegnathos saltator]